MQICVTECWETRVTIIDKYLSCLRNQTQLLETGTQHYQVANAGYSATAKSSFTCRHASNLTCSAGDLFLPSFSSEKSSCFKLCGYNSMLRQKNNQSTAKQQKQWPLLQWSHSPHSQHCFKWSSRFCSLKARPQLRPPQTHRAITGSPLLQNIPVQFFPWVKTNPS